MVDFIIYRKIAFAVIFSARCGLKIVIASEEGVPKRYFCTFGGKEYESIRQAFVACDD